MVWSFFVPGFSRKSEGGHPPVVPEALGWSPHRVGNWLAAHGLRVRAYDPGFDEWSGSSESLKLKEGIFHDYLAYRITGTATSATRLTLTLTKDVLREDDLPDASIQAFSDALFLLLVEVFGPDAPLVAKGLKRPERQSIVRDIQVAITNDRWTMKFEITHPAHIEAY